MRKLLAMVAILLPAPLWARIYFNDGVFPELAVSARALGMGNAYLSKVDDASAVWYNPAGLGTVRYPRFHLSNLHLEVNKGWAGALGHGINLKQPFSLFKPDHVRQLLLKNRDSFYHGRAQMVPNFTFRFFSLGVLYSSRIRGHIGSREDALFEFADRRDWGPFLALNLSFMGGIVKLGMSTIYLNRSESYSERDPRQAFTGKGGDARKGNILLSTGGFRLTLPWQALPTFSLKVNNVLGSSFKAVGAPQLPLSIPGSMDVGFSLTPQISPTTRLHMEFNYRDLTGEFPSDIESRRGVTGSRRIALGMELDFSRTLFLRLGYADGFGSLGLGMSKRGVEYHLTTYATETTASRFHNKQDRRFVLSFSRGL